ncbi:MAG: hypothetical protein ACQEQY_01835 [Halobacteriota archaeon]
MRRATLGVLLLVVLAGCSSAIAPPGGSPAVAPSDEANETREGITVTNGTIPFDHEGLFAEVTTMLAVEAEPPETIRLEPDENMGIQREPMPPFFQLVGIERPAGTARTATALGYVADPSTVHLNEKLIEDETQLRQSLVHEYVHIVQGRTGTFDRLRTEIPASNTTDATIVRRSVLEGGAMLVETRYWERHVDDGRSPAERMERSYRATSGARQWVFAPYHFGYVYVDTRTDSPAEVQELYASPPHTSEELIHGLPGGSEPLPRLDVAVDAEDWTVERTDRTGELFVRVALDTELSTEAAKDAAAGWGTDSRVALSNDDERAYVWALRWDDPTNATEFEDAFEAYLDARASRDDGVWVDEGAAFDATRVDDETVVVLLGNETFVRGTTVDGTNGTVDVSA